MSLPQPVAQRISEHLGGAICQTNLLGGGCIGKVHGIILEDGRQIVAKLPASDGTLAIEGFMLRYLATKTSLPVPKVLFCEDKLLVLQFLPSTGALDKEAEIDAADAIADLHRITQTTFGFECDTVIGGLPQPNPSSETWLDFFRDFRLCYMADQALASGRLPVELRRRIDRLAGQLDRWIINSTPPALLHGDLWGGNILCAQSRVAGFIDPAIYFGDPEIELAFTRLFNTFTSVFYDRYKERQKINPGFFEERCDLYNLYPLLVHIRLFGAAYEESVRKVLVKHGC